ncbi:MAG TPA: hypothetical protein VKK31_04880 [Thermoanaerobaculia bacterium]|nr:hypothetical protein [Thermoanaerobaculia bacterium]
MPQDPQDFTPLQVVQNCLPTMPPLLHDWHENVQAIGTGAGARPALVRAGASGAVAACGALRLARKASSPTEAGLANTIEEVRRATAMTASDARLFNIRNSP